MMSDSSSDLEIHRKSRKRKIDHDEKRKNELWFAHEDSSSSEEEMSPKDRERYLLSANQLKRKYKHLIKPVQLNITKMKMSFMNKWLHDKAYNWRALFPTDYSKAAPPKQQRKFIQESNLFGEVLSHRHERSKHKSKDGDRPKTKKIQIVSSSFAGIKKKTGDDLEVKPKYTAKPKFARFMSKQPLVDLEEERREERVATAVSAALHQYDYESRSQEGKVVYLLTSLVLFLFC